MRKDKVTKKRQVRRLMAAAAALCSLILCFAFPGRAKAETYYGGSDWCVQFNASGQLETNFGSSDMDEIALNMQPGDNMVIGVKILNQYAQDTDWYMSNKVIESLEDASETAQGGAYTYTLIYTDGSGRESVLFDSDTVGGDSTDGGKEGLNEATNGMEDYFFLDTLSVGESGTVVLEIALDGETQGNGYQDTRAALQMDFAVETATGGTSEIEALHASPVKTGDVNSNLYYLYGAMLSAGVTMAILACANRKKEGGR